MEPGSPIDVIEFTAALAAIAHQFEVFAVENKLAARPKDVTLLVSSVRPGSIDIGLLPDLAASVGPLLAQLSAHLTPIHVLEFATKLKGLIDAFRERDSAPAGVSVKDCDDVAAIVGPIANHGGTQIVNVHNGNIYNQVVYLDAQSARKIGRNAARAKAELQHPASDIRQRVAMVWAGMDTDKPRSKGHRNPDKGIIEDIDARPRPVFFEDKFSYLKADMLEGEENPYRLIYFVDVSVSRVEGKIASYRIVGFHGTAERDDEGDGEAA